MDKCKCGSKEFFLNEYLIHRAVLDKGVLSVYKCTDNEIEKIFCIECDTIYEGSDFSSIEF